MRDASALGDASLSVCNRAASVAGLPTVLPGCRENSGKLGAALAAVARKDAAELIKCKALREGQLAALKTLTMDGGACITDQVRTRWRACCSIDGGCQAFVVKCMVCRWHERFTFLCLQPIR